MLGFIIKCVLTLTSLLSTISFFASGHWGWGIVFIFITALFGVFFFRHERMILALNQMRMGDHDKAKHHINKITLPQLLPRKQHAYILYLKAVLGTQELGFAKTEQLLRKAIMLGLRTSQDNAVARMHLAGICMQTARRPEAVALLAEAKKMDSNGMMRDQISQMQKQMQVAPSKNQMRMAQMMGGRQKTPRKK